MSFYITCAIDYPNSQPHVGTAYEKIAADAITRYRRLAGQRARLLMGLDEHSQNVQKRAAELGLEPGEFCDRMEVRFREAWAAVNVEYDDFIRTSEPRHHRAVVAMVERARQSGDLYEGTYEGWYCVSCEAYYLERDLEDGLCPVHSREPEWRQEENVFFRLSSYQERLRAHFAAHPGFLQPDVRRNEILSLIDQGLEDVSVSRTGAGWGVPMPDHPEQTVYVWFDALTNYLSALGFPDDTELFREFWPADMHLVGKDITRFHAVIWPAMLMSAGIELPRVVFGHGWVLTGGGRMSKSIGNVMDPIAMAELVGADALRYFLLREAPFGRDLDFDLERLVGRYNADLANDLGNLLQRTVSMVGKYREGGLPDPDGGAPVTDLLERARRVVPAYREAMDAYDLEGGLKAAWELVQAANLAIDTHKPWELAKDPGAGARLDAVLRELLATLWRLAILVHPVMPERSTVMAERLGMSRPPAEWRLEQLDDDAAGPRSPVAGDALFPRLDADELLDG